MPSSSNHEAKFWNAGTAHWLSVLPSKFIEALVGLRGAPFVARAGNGVVYYRSEKRPGADNLPTELMRRVKDAYDPKHIFPEMVL